MKKENKKITSQIKMDNQLNEFVSKVKKGKYSKELISGSLRINTCYNTNSTNIPYIFGVK